MHLNSDVFTKQFITKRRNVTLFGAAAVNLVHLVVDLLGSIVLHCIAGLFVSAAVGAIDTVDSGAFDAVDAVGLGAVQLRWVLVLLMQLVLVLLDAFGTVGAFDAFGAVQLLRVRASLRASGRQT